MLATCLYAEQIHDEIWVFNRFWSKDSALWNDIKGCSWDDVVMKEERKQALQKDIYGVFLIRDDVQETVHSLEGWYSLYSSVVAVLLKFFIAWFDLVWTPRQDSWSNDSHAC